MKKRVLLSFSGLLSITALLSFSWKSENNSTKTASGAVADVFKISKVEHKTIIPVSELVYNQLNLASAGLDYDVFQKALTGYTNLTSSDPSALKRPIITVVDFSKPSTEKRFWVIDLTAKKLLYSTWVSHGQGSGQKMAETFSNEPNSYQSSLGFYKTAEIYYGKHGRSLKLDGLDKGFNDKARERAIVIHGADYANEDFIKKTGRLGRSQGCPALPLNLSREIIDNIEGNTLMFIYGKDTKYSSNLLKSDISYHLLYIINIKSRRVPAFYV